MNVPERAHTAATSAATFAAAVAHDAHPATHPTGHPRSYSCTLTPRASTPPHLKLRLNECRREDAELSRDLAHQIVVVGPHEVVDEVHDQPRQVQLALADKVVDRTYQLALEYLQRAVTRHAMRVREGGWRHWMRGMRRARFPGVCGVRGAARKPR